MHSKLLQFIHRNQRLRGTQSRRSSDRTAGSRPAQRKASSGRPADRRVCADAVHRIVVRLRALAIDAELSRLANADGGRVELRRLRHDSRREQDQILKAPAIQRHVLYVRLIHHCPDRCTRGVDHRRSTFDRDRLADRADLHSKVQGNIILHVQLDVGLHDL